MNFNPKVNFREIDVSKLPKIVYLAKQEKHELEEVCLDLKYPLEGKEAEKQMCDCMLCERTFVVSDELEELCPECREQQNFMRSISKN